MTASDAAIATRFMNPPLGSGSIKIIGPEVANVHEETADNSVSRRCAAWPRGTAADSRSPFREWQPHKRTVSRWSVARDVRDGLLLGRRTEVLADEGRLQHRGWICRGA